jgi:hypothetical protein
MRGRDSEVLCVCERACEYLHLQIWYIFMEGTELRSHEPTWWSYLSWQVPQEYDPQCHYIVTWRPKTGIVKSEKTSIARQLLSKLIPAVTNTQAKIE